MNNLLAKRIKAILKEEAVRWAYKKLDKKERARTILELSNFVIISDVSEMLAIAMESGELFAEETDVEQ